METIFNAYQYAIEAGMGGRVSIYCLACNGYLPGRLEGRVRIPDLMATIDGHDNVRHQTVLDKPSA